MKVLFVSQPGIHLLTFFSEAVHSIFPPGNPENCITEVHSLNAAVDLICSNKYDLVISQENIPAGAETHVVESFIGCALVAICTRKRLRLALLIREDSPLHVENLDLLNLKSKGGDELAYFFTQTQIVDHQIRKGIEFALFKVADNGNGQSP